MCNVCVFIAACHGRRRLQLLQLVRAPRVQRSQVAVVDCTGCSYQFGWLRNIQASAHVPLHHNHDGLCARIVIIQVLSFCFAATIPTPTLIPGMSVVYGHSTISSTRSVWKESSSSPIEPFGKSRLDQSTLLMMINILLVFLCSKDDVDADEEEFEDTGYTSFDMELIWNAISPFLPFHAIDSSEPISIVLANWHSLLSFEYRFASH